MGRSAGGVAGPANGSGSVLRGAEGGVATVGGGAGGAEAEVATGEGSGRGNDGIAVSVPAGASHDSAFEGTRSSRAAAPRPTESAGPMRSAPEEPDSL